MVDRTELINRCVAGDREAWGSFHAVYKGLVEKSVEYKLNKMKVRFRLDMHADIVQEIFLDIWEKNKLARLENIATLECWLSMISVNATINYCKKNLFKRSGSIISLEEEVTDRGLDGSKTLLKQILPGSSFTAEDESIASEMKCFIEEEIGNLDAKKKLAFKLNAYHGKTFKDIGEMMNIPTNTVATLVRRVKGDLSEKISKYFELKCLE
ncbi:MAG: sigma-70 family RNA polymerase sigma factor [Candidatus Omnitrophica bacterium]|nr:sigma-70 family RNA polymerase sigma factor [Candidatus Omnitrophota bacterium]